MTPNLSVRPNWSESPRKIVENRPNTEVQKMRHLSRKSNLRLQETVPGRTKCDRGWQNCICQRNTCWRNITQAVRMRHLSTKRCLGAQNAIHVEEMLPKRSECDTCRQNAASVLKMRHLSTKCCLVAQNAIHVEEIQPKRSECHTCRQNATWTLRMRYMSKKCYLSAQNAAPVEKTEPRCSSREIAENEQGL